MTARTSLDRDVLIWTIRHLLKHGDTDIFPHPIEFKFFAGAADAIADAAAEIDLNTYRPVGALECLAPKSKHGFRLTHQLFPIDCLLFTASLVTVGEDIERARLPADGKVAFAYRFSPDLDGNLFSLNHRFRDWMSSLFYKTIFHSDQYSEIVTTDISDFYQRIYHHRLQNALLDATKHSKHSEFILRVIKHYRARQ